MRKGKKWLAIALSAAMATQSIAAAGPVSVQAADGISITGTFKNDAVFRKYVSNEFDTDHDGYLSAEEIEGVTEIDIHDIDTKAEYGRRAVTNVDGIEVFTNVARIDCSGQGIKNMDIQNMTKLASLDVSDNMMETLTLPSRADDLVYLNIGGNKITELTSLADYDNLTYLNASETNLEEVDVRSMKGLKFLSVSGLSLKSLDLSENTKLESLWCQSMSGLSTLDVSNHTELTTLVCDGKTSSIKGSFTKIDVSGDTSLALLECGSNNLVDLNITNTPSLVQLDVSNTNLKSIDISKNTGLRTLAVDGTALGTLDVTANTMLTTLSAASADLASIDISTLSNLTSLDLSGNELTKIDTTMNTNLKKLILDNNKLESLDLYDNPALYVLSVNNNRLVCIDISSCPNLFATADDGEEHSFSCSGNSRDIVLDKPNYDFNLTTYNREYGFHRAWEDEEIRGTNPNTGKEETGRQFYTVGYAGLALGTENGSAVTVTGGTINSYNLNANLNATAIKYKYYYGIGKGKVDFTLNIVNPLTVVVYYTLNGQIEKTGDSVMKCVVGSTTKLVAKDKDGNLHDSVTWSSNNNNVAYIDPKTGDLTCKADGSAQITTNLNGRPVGYINIECHNPVSSMSFVDRINKTSDGKEIVYGNDSVIEMEKGTYGKNKSISLSPRFSNENGVVNNEFAGYDCVVSDSKTDSGVASSNVIKFSNGVISAVGQGIAYLHFTSKDNPNTKIVIQVNVTQRADGIELNKRTMSMIAGRTASLAPKFNPVNTKNQDVIWESSDDSVVSVDKDGKLTAHAPGTADITCSAVDNPDVLKAKCTITVLGAVAGVSMDKPECTLTLPGTRTVQLNVDIAGDSTANYTKTWVSSDPTVATVSSTGYVNAMKRGTTIITCYLADDLFAICEVTVKQAVTAIDMNAEKDTMLVGEKIKVTASVIPEDANVTALKWSSSDSKIATVDKYGNVTAVNKGSVTITAAATDGSGRSRSVRILVKKMVADVKLAQTSLVTYVDRTGRVDVTVTPADASDKNIIWKSSDNKIATVSGGSAAVMVTGVKPGIVTITGTTSDGSNIVRKFKVRVYQQITGFSFKVAEKKLNVGSTFKNTYTIVPANADSKAITWKSSNTSVATVAADGTVKAVGRGYAAITAVPKDGVGMQGSYTVNVIQPVTKVTLNATKIKLVKSGTYYLSANLLPSNANDRTVTWKSSNTKVATVSATGYVKAVGLGTATITCKAKDGSGKYATCTVSVVQMVTSVKLSATKKTMIVGSSATLKATVAPANATNKKVVWSSSNKKVATVTATGVVKAVGKGTAVITCKAADGSGKVATCTITSIIRVSSIKLNKATITIKKGVRFTLKATVAPASASNKTVTWVSSNKGVATVAPNGIVIGVKKGKAVITCKATDGSGKIAKCTVVVK